MRGFLKSISAQIMRLAFEPDFGVSVTRAAAAFCFAVWVIVDPFAASGALKIYLYAVCGAVFVCLLGFMRGNRKGVVAATGILLLLLFAIFRGRGDAVSGIAAAVFAVFTAFASFFSAVRSRNRWQTLFSAVCGVAALLVSAVIMIRSGQLGVRYLDHLHCYCLCFAGCGLATLSQMKRK